MDENGLNAFVGRMLDEFGAMRPLPLVRIGDAFGLCKAVHNRGR